MDVQQDTNLIHMNEFELHDFIDDPNFDQFINLLRGDNEDSICNFNADDLLNGCLADNQFLSFPATPIFECNNNAAALEYNACDPTLSSFSCFDGEVKGGGGGEEENESSATTITTNENARHNGGNAKQRAKTDRSKTLICERRRRGRMKEKLYALRSLVPNITKVSLSLSLGCQSLKLTDKILRVYDFT